ncbi:MAG: putative RNA methyltransferase [Clostridia bacterium]|jgi:23S rRNA (guanine745-N1)-methyltransferase
MKKIEWARKIFHENEHLFQCPICGHGMYMSEERVLACINSHSYDLARQGYVNFLSGSKKTGYDRMMLESRSLISKEGLYTPLTEEISRILGERPAGGDGTGVILDAGCGEGSHLKNVLDLRRQGTEKKIQGVGIDISKDGIQIAAREWRDILWCVADLAKMPFRNRQFDVLLNIFSPSNYGEFTRVLKEDGILLKAVPGSRYLMEIRNLFYGNTEKETYSNERTVELFKRNFQLLDIRELVYQKAVRGDLVEHLIRMTPLSWGADDKARQKAIETGIPQITIDVAILVGRPFNSI